MKAVGTTAIEIILPCTLVRYEVAGHEKERSTLPEEKDAFKRVHLISHTI